MFVCKLNSAIAQGGQHKGAGRAASQAAPSWPPGTKRVERKESQADLTSLAFFALYANVELRVVA
jgi:hypothetical protein